MRTFNFQGGISISHTLVLMKCLNSNVFRKIECFCIHLVLFRSKAVTWDPFQALAKNKEFFLKICSLLPLLFCRTKNLFLKICSCQASTFDWWLKYVKVNGNGRNKEAREHNAAINHFLYKRVTKPSFHFIICNMHVQTTWRQWCALINTANPALFFQGF